MINILALRTDRKKARQASERQNAHLAVGRQKARQTAENKSNKALTARAMKYTGKPGEFGHLSPAAEINLLREYANELEDEAIDLLGDFGEDANNAVGLMRVERQRAIDRLGKITQVQLKPELL